MRKTRSQAPAAAICCLFLLASLPEAAPAPRAADGSVPGPAAASAPVPAAAPATPPGPPLRITFAPSQEPLVLFTDGFTSTRPGQARKGPVIETAGAGAAGDLWFGILPRRLPDEALDDGPHYVPFAALFGDGVARKAWFDLNLNHDLRDDAPQAGRTEPGAPGVRLFDFDLRWSAPFGSGEVTIARSLCVIVSPCLEEKGCAPQYRVVDMAPLRGTVVLDGKPRRALMYDGSGDGLYTARSGLDGVVIDQDGNGTFDGFDEIRMYSPEYGGLSGRMQLGRTIYEAGGADPRGSEVTLRPVGEAEPVIYPAPGEPVPDVSFVDEAGGAGSLGEYRGRVLVLYFTASWCHDCEGETRRLRALYEKERRRGLEVLTVSLDADREAWKSYAAATPPPGRRCFTGRWLWENPFSRPFLVNSAPTYVVIDREGRYEGGYGEVKAVARAIAPQLKRPASPAAR